MAKIAFKSDNQKQSLLLPPSLDELIPLTHSVRVVNAMIDRLDVDAILHTYRGGGNSCSHPRQMLKILVYAYLNNIYSSRRIAQQLSENIHYMWLSGGAKPDFRTFEGHLRRVVPPGRGVTSQGGLRIARSTIYRWHEDRIGSQ